MSAPQSSSNPSPNAVYFARGVISLLSTWPALRVAVDQSWGGPDSTQKRTWLAGVIVDAFTENSNPELPDAEYVEEILLQIMEDEFECVLEDGSAKTVGEKITKLWDTISSQSEAVVKSEIQKLETESDKAKGKKVEFVQGVSEDPEEEWTGSEDDDDDDEADSDNEAPQLLQPQAPKAREAPVIDEDGFTLVQGKSKAKR